MARIATDLQEAYGRQFGKDPVVPKERELQEFGSVIIDGQKLDSLSQKGSTLIALFNGVEVWLPIKFYDLDASIFGKSELMLPYAVISLSSSKSITKTPLAERKGTAKELFSLDDYQIDVKGFLIGKDKSGKYPIWPEEDLEVLHKLDDLTEAVKLDNALTNIFIGDSGRVVISKLKIPFLEGGKKNMIPFSFEIESDNIFTLELK